MILGPGDLRAIITGSKLRPSSQKIYLSDLERYLKFAGAQPEDWTRAKTKAFYQSLIAAGMKPQSANRVLASLAYVGKWYAIENSNLNLDFSKIQLVANTKSAPRTALTEMQARKLLDTCAGHKRTPRDRRDFAALVMMLETGARRMSVCGMRWENTSKKPPIALVPLKGVTELYGVPLSDTTLRALAPWRAWSDTQGAGRQGPVFRSLRQRLTDTGKDYVAGAEPLTAEGIYEIVKARAAEAGLDAYPHILRHTFNTWRSEMGTPPLVVAMLTGHKVPGYGTLNTYLDRTSERLIEQARASTPLWLAEYVEGNTP